MLSNLQKRDLSILARKAFDMKRQAVLPAYELELDGRFYTTLPSGTRQHADAQTTFLLRGDSASANEWRHNEVARACGKLGLRCCGQGDYNQVLAHFHRMLGNNGAADYATRRSATDGRRTAENKIAGAVQELGKNIFYAEGISRKMFGLTLNEASEKQLWKVFYALRYQLNRQPKTTHN